MAVDLIRIDVGSSPNDGQGTPLREAFEIVNTNFAALAQEQDLTNVNNAVNIGNVGVGLFAEKVERILEFKKLVGGSGIAVTDTGDTVTLSSAIGNVSGSAGDFVAVNSSGALFIPGIMRYDLLNDTVDLTQRRIGNSASPIFGNDLTTKNYVDSQVFSQTALVSVGSDGVSSGLFNFLNFNGATVSVGSVTNRADITIQAGTNTNEVQAIVGEMFTNNLSEGIITSYANSVQKINISVQDFDITLTGDVTGSATVTNFAENIVINTTAPFMRGLTVNKDSADVGGSNTIRTLNFTGQNISVSRDGNTVSIAVATGLTDTDVRNEIGTTIKGVVADPFNPAIETESGITTRYRPENNTMELGVRDFDITLTGAVSGTGVVSRLQDVSIFTTSNAIEGISLQSQGLPVGLPNTVRTLNFTGDNITVTRASSSDSTAQISVSSVITGDQVSAVLNPRMLGNQDGLTISFDSLNKIYNYRLDPITINLAGAVSGTGTVTFNGSAQDGVVTINTSGAGGGGGVTVADEGNTQGQASTINFVGGGITTAVSLDGTVATVYVPNSPAAEPFITAVAGSENIPNSRLLVAGTGITLVDGGPGANVTISAASDAIIAKSTFALNGTLVAEQFGININSSRFIVNTLENDVGNNRVNLNIYTLLDAWYREAIYDAGTVTDNQGPVLDFGVIVGGILETTPDLGVIA